MVPPVDKSKIFGKDESDLTSDVDFFSIFLDEINSIFLIFLISIPIL